MSSIKPGEILQTARMSGRKLPLRDRVEYVNQTGMRTCGAYGGVASRFCCDMTRSMIHIIRIKGLAEWRPEMP